VRTEEKASNLAYTPVPLSVHTDNPYRDPVPGIQLLHCLVQASEGGVTTLVDGIAAAEALRDDDPIAFELLASKSVSFRYSSADAVLENSTPTICLDGSGEVAKIRVNNRSLAPPCLGFDDTLPWYKALCRFRRELEHPVAQARFRLKPGQLGECTPPAFSLPLLNPLAGTRCDGSRWSLPL
jgi:gamma-butyrobetaine dioxygenase